MDFVGLTANLAQLQSSAQSAGVYFSSSGSQGYHIVLKTNNTFDLYKVTQQVSMSSSCQSDSSASQTAGWGSWSIQNQTFLKNYAIPANGVIFAADNVWVDGQINNSRVTIAVGVFPYSSNTSKSITVNHNLLYSNFNGNDSIALIAQNNVNVGFSSDDTFSIDGALVAQNGRAGRFYYASSCGTGYIRTSLTLFGMIATDVRYGFAYTDGTGYQTRNINYDANMLYSPPPSFPLTASQYVTLSWQEVN